MYDAHISHKCVRICVRVHKHTVPEGSTQLAQLSLSMHGTGSSTLGNQQGTVKTGFCDMKDKGSTLLIYAISHSMSNVCSHSLRGGVMNRATSMLYFLGYQRTQ